MLKMPQIITSNLTPKIVDKFFVLLNEITDSQVKDEKMYQFLVKLHDYDGDPRNIVERTNEIIKINTAYSRLSFLQKKIVNRTFELVFMTLDTKPIMEKYLYEMKLIISKESKP